MPRPQVRLSVSIDLARILIRFASDNGLDEMKICEMAGLDPRLLQSGDARIPARRFDALWQAVEAETGNVHFGLQMGRAMKDYAGGHLLYAVLMNSPTVKTALTKFCRYHCILSNVVQPRLADDGKPPKIILETPHPGITIGIGHNSFIFSLFASIIETLTGSRDNITEVRFPHPVPDHIDAYQEAFACPIRFQSGESALLIEKNAMDRPVFLANPELLSGLETMALKLADQLSTENAAGYKAATAISRMLASGDKPTIEAVAKALAMSTRGLQQRLKAEGTSYRGILDQVRKQTAIRLLKDAGNTISDITFILGFSEQSGFTHAFQKWTGTSPGQYRKNEGLMK